MASSASSSSPDGAGVVAAGADLGVDLVLDGSTNAQTDTLLSQSGIDRRSASAETFTIENSGGGGLNVAIAGAVTADSFAGEGSGLTGVTVDDIECAGCVGTDDLALDSITGGNVVAGSLTGSDILDNSITSSDIGTNAVQSSEIASLAVGNSELAPSAVTSSKIATNAVDSRTIGTNAVRAPELATIRVVSVECGSSCVESTLGLVCGPGFEAIGVDCDAIDSDSVTVPCGGNNRCSRQNLSNSSPLSNFCLGITGTNGADAHVFCIPE